MSFSHGFSMNTGRNLCCYNIYTDFYAKNFIMIYYCSSPSSGNLLLLHPSSPLGLIALSFSTGWAGGESGREGNVAERWIWRSARSAKGGRHLMFTSYAPPHVSQGAFLLAYLVCRPARKDTPHRWEFYSSCISPHFLLIISKKAKESHFLFKKLQIW